MNQNKTKLYFMHIAERQTLKIIPQICLIFNFKMFGLPPLHMQKAYFFGHNFFISEPIFKIFVGLLTTFESCVVSAAQKSEIKKKMLVLDGCVKTHYIQLLLYHSSFCIAAFAYHMNFRA